MTTAEAIENEIPAGFLDEALSGGSASIQDLESSFNLPSFEPSKTQTLDGKPQQQFMLSYNSADASEAHGLTVPIIGDYLDIIKNAAEGLVNEKEFENVGVFGFAYKWAKKKLFGYLSKTVLPSEKRTGSILIDYVGAKLDQWSTQAVAEFKTAVEKSFPGMLKFTAMFNGSTDIDEMHTINHNGKDFAVFMKRKGGEDPSEAELLEHIKFVQENGRSPYYRTTRPKKGKSPVSCKGGCDLKTFLNEDFKEKSIMEFTSGDSQNFGPIREPVYEWVARFDTWLIYQYGKRSSKDVGGHTVTVHKRPGSLRFGSAYIWGDVLNSAQSGATKAYADMTKTVYGIDSAADFLLDTKYKSVFRSLMGFFNPRAGNFAYE